MLHYNPQHISSSTHNFSSWRRARYCSKHV